MLLLTKKSVKKGKQHLSWRAYALSSQLNSTHLKTDAFVIRLHNNTPGVRGELGGRVDRSIHLEVDSFQIDSPCKQKAY